MAPRGGAFKKVVVPAAAIAGDVPLTPEARALLTEHAEVADLVRAYVGQELHADAVRLLARALPKREAVWWACLCARDALPPDPSPAATAALEAAEAWVYKPVEERRRAAMACAEAAGYDVPAAWAAMAAFWSGGSLSPPDNPVVPPAEHLTGLAAAGAILLASARDPRQMDARRRRFLDYGVDIADGGNGRERSGEPTGRSV
jgi:hypothetical protein